MKGRVKPMINPLQQLNRFFELATEKKLHGNAQLVYLHLFNQFNRAHWAETLYIKDADLLQMINCYDSSGKPTSIETIRRAKQVLKAKNFIDFKSGKGNCPTQYQLINLTPVNTPANTPADIPTAPLIVNSPILDFKENVKTLNINAGASAREDDINEVDVILEAWENSGGAKLNQLIISKIAALLKEYSSKEIKAAIEKSALSSNNRYGFSFDFFVQKLKKDTPKGVNTNEEYNYTRPSGSKKPEWYNEN